MNRGGEILRRGFFLVVGATLAVARKSPTSCHSEPVTDVTGVGIRMALKGERIATLACALVRNDR